MNSQYPAKAPVYLALTRPALIFGVSVEYFMMNLVMTLSLIIVFDRLCFIILGLVMFVVGRFIFYIDHHLVFILMSKLKKLNNRVNIILGYAYYEMG